MRFIADTMLGTLTKWLRVLGFDTIYVRDMSDGDIVILAKEESRILLSRDRELCARVTGAMQIEGIVLENQIRQVLASYPADENAVLSRCLECNSLLIDISKNDALGRVPEHAHGTHDEFLECKACGKIYWKGTHYHRMREKVNGFLAQCVS